MCSRVIRFSASIRFRQMLVDVVLPAATGESAWRETLRDGSIETFFASYKTTDMTSLDELIEFHDDRRVEYIRANPSLFAR